MENKINHIVTIRKGANRFTIIKALFVFIEALPVDGEFDVVITKHKKTRTKLQNRSFHKYFSLLASTLNDAGLDMRKMLKEGVDIPWTETSVKEQLWRPIQVAMYNKESTTELETHEVSKVYEVLNENLGTKLGIYVSFPNRDDKEEINGN